MSTLSERGRKCTKTPPAYLVKSFEAWKDPFDPDSNPKGYINLSVAENALSLPFVSKKLQSAPPAALANLTYGTPEHFNDVMARFMSEKVFNTAVNGENIVVVNGGTSAIDCLATALCDEGDEVLTFGPGYRSLESDVQIRPGAKLITVPLDTKPGEKEREPRIEVEALQRMWEEKGGEDSQIKMVIVCTPNNPTGEVLSANVVRELAEWGAEKKIHMIFDEIYANSVFKEGVKFVSVVEEMNGSLGDYAHVVWSFSKDFCLSGCRVGLIYTQNKELITCLNSYLAFLSSPSRYTLWDLEQMLTDKEWVDEYLQGNKVRLRKAYQRLEINLKEMQIPFMEAEAGFFVWIDLREWMRNNTKEEEENLWEMLIEARVMLTPSNQCFGSRFGHFRVCYAAVDGVTLELGLRRMQNVLIERTKELYQQ